MKNNAHARTYHIGRAAQLLEEMYDLVVPIHKIRECAIRIFHNAAPIDSRSYLFRGKVEKYILKLPCDFDNIVSVTGKSVTDEWVNRYRDHETLFRYYAFDKNRTVTAIGDPNNPEAYLDLPDWSIMNSTEVIIELPEGIEMLSKPHAYFVPYSINQNLLTFNQTDICVDVIFTKIKKDENEFPYFSEKGIFAVVQYMVYLDQLKRFYKKEGNENAVRFAKDEYERAVAQARSPESLTDNQADDLMKTLVSKNRHKFGNPFRVQ